MVPNPDVDAYFSALTNEDAKATLTRLRAIIFEEAPEAEECISYGMPGYKLNGYLLGYAAFKNHCSLFPTGTVENFAHLLSGYKTSKGTIQFPSNDLLPEDVVRTIVRTRIAEYLAKG
jgi:uncharacterized protein YdhG (YjbR/CyaY superfamily)